MTGIALCRKPLRVLARSKLMRWALGGSGERPAAAHQTALDMNRWFRGPRRGADLAAFYSAEDSAIVAFAFVITESARFIAALSSSLCHASTDRPSSNDRSLASCARATSSRSASMASTSSLVSPSSGVGRVISSSLQHGDYGPPGSMVTTCVYRHCALCNLHSLVRGWLCSGSDRGGQDKSRKVRPVGWMRNSAKFRLSRNIARVSRNLRFSATHYRPTTFYTLRSER
jgi:hypothetical protein